MVLYGFPAVLYELPAVLYELCLQLNHDLRVLFRRVLYGIMSESRGLSFHVLKWAHVYFMRRLDMNLGGFQDKLETWISVAR
jgi:hypothetical protein